MPAPTPPTLTPEHLQLFSDQRLEKASTHDDASPAADRDPAMERAARYELRRRSGEVPVKDRYHHHAG